MWNTKQKATNKNNKTNKNKLIGTGNLTVVTRREEVSREGENGVTEGNSTSGGEHIIQCTDVELQCCTHENYIML